MDDLNNGLQTGDNSNRRVKFPAKFKGFVSGMDTSKVKSLIASSAAKQTVAACIIGTLLMGGAIYYYNNRKSAYAVSYDGKFVGYIKDKKVAENALTDIKEEMKKQDSSIIVDDSLKFDKILIGSDRLTSMAKIEEAIGSGLYAQYTSYTITVNGNEMAVVATEDEAKQVLDGVKKYFEEQEQKDNIQVLDIAIKDDIKVDKKVVNNSKKVDVKTAIGLLISSKGTTKQYTVQSGDTIWQIARNNDMKIQEIADVNSGIDVNKLHIGQVINLSVSIPYLNVETTIQVASDENIPYSTSYVNDGSLYKGQSKVVTSGQYGINKVTKKITKLNGKEIASAVLSTVLVKNPVTQVLAKGTKALVGSGMFAWPTSGHVSSPFGSRGREYHKGIDIAAPYGTAISASDSGTVTQAGWYYGYGNLIIIDHGNGYQTYYGHCSSIAVSVGQSVKRGQYIGAVGHTGDAYGNHVHFEIRVNGSAQNPLRYLN
jgi:Membrane proteins related to metalloendopeptidases